MTYFVSGGTYKTLTQSFHLGKSDLQCLDFTFNRFCKKLFKSENTEVVKDCQRYFDIDLPSSGLTKRQDKFIARYKYSDNIFD